MIEKQNTMKTIINAFTFYVFTIIACLAAETPPEPKPSPNIPRLTSADLRPSFYNAGEFSVDAFAFTTFHRFDTLFERDNGGGIGVNWFPFRSAGLGIEVMSTDTEHSFIDSGALKLLGRLPWERFAVNIGLGSGFDFERDEWSVFAEAGPEFRFTKLIGAFANIRGVRPIDGPEGEHILVIAGIRLTF